MAREWSVQGAVSAAIGLAVTLAGGVGVYFAVAVLQAQRSYDSAPMCASESDAFAGKACRLNDTAFVVATPSGGLRLVVGSAPGHWYTTNVRGVVLAPGSTVPVELWAGRITRAGGEQTTDNPNYTAPGAQLIALAVFVIAAGAWVLVVAYRRRSEPREPAEALGTMNPVATSGLIYRP